MSVGKAAAARPPSMRATVYDPIAAFASLSLPGRKIGAAARRR
jgi:hypothetical protein